MTTVIEEKNNKINQERGNSKNSNENQDDLENNININQAIGKKILIHILIII